MICFSLTVCYSLLLLFAVSILKKTAKYPKVRGRERVSTTNQGVLVWLPALGKPPTVRRPVLNLLTHAALQLTLIRASPFLLKWVEGLSVCSYVHCMIKIFKSFCIFTVKFSSGVWGRNAEVEAHGFRIVTTAEKRVQHTDPGFSL